MRTGIRTRDRLTCSRHERNSRQRTRVPSLPRVKSSARALSSAHDRHAFAARRCPAIGRGAPRTEQQCQAPVLAWRLQTGGPVRSSPAIADRTVYVGGTDGRVYAIDVASGVELWTARIGGAIASTPALSTDRVFVSTRSNDVIALDRRSGKEVWRARTGPDITTHPGGEHWDYFSSSPTLAGDAVLVGSGDGRLHALRAGSGTTIWTFKADGRIRGSSRVKDGAAIFGTIRGSVYAVSIADGRERWRFETDGFRIDSAAATDEFGRAAAWIKGFSGPRGTGYVRIWGSTGILSDVHLRDMRTVAERVVATSAR